MFALTIRSGVTDALLMERSLLRKTDSKNAKGY